MSSPSPISCIHKEGETFLEDSLNNNYHPYYSQKNDLQAVRSAIISDAEDGKLSSY